MRSALRIACFVALVFAGLGCDGTPATHHCQDIINVCHDVDPGTGPAHDCHETAHDGDEAACEPMRDECVSLCESLSPVEHDGGHGEHDGGHDEHDGG